MNSFSVYMPTRLLFGSDKLTDFVNLSAQLGKTFLFVTGGGSVKRNGYYDKVYQAFKEKGLELCEFSGIEANPLSSTIDKCVEEFKDRNITTVIGFGGGSVMDAAKAISCMLYIYNNSFTDKFPLGIWNYVLGEPYANKLPGALPLVMIPTTAATASEVTPFSVISNKEKGGKAPIRFEEIKPKISWLNPEFTLLLSKTVTADGGSDILSHVFENYLIGGETGLEITDLYCEGIIRTVISTLPRLLDDPHNIELRANLQWTSTLALNEMQSAGRNPSIFPLHAIEHAMSAVKHDLAHGRGLATLFPAYFRWLWNKGRARNRLNRLAQEIFRFSDRNNSSGLYFIEEFENWLKSCGLLQSAKCLGFNEADYETIADYTIKTYGDSKDLNVLGPMGKLDIIEILNLTHLQVQ